MRISLCSLHLGQYHWSEPERNSSLSKALKQFSKVRTSALATELDLTFSLVPLSIEKSVFLRTTPKTSALLCFNRSLTSPRVTSFPSFSFITFSLTENWHQSLSGCYLSQRSQQTCSILHPFFSEGKLFIATSRTLS